jgi:hypothetical protein
MTGCGWEPPLKATLVSFLHLSVTWSAFNAALLLIVSKVSALTTCKQSPGVDGVTGRDERTFGTINTHALGWDFRACGAVRSGASNPV